MALPTITLDDRSFEQLFAFMRKQIATNEWSDHNYSDPGIVLLDLLCWVGEMVLYRANLVPDSHIDKFADFILDPPEPVTAQLTLNATLNAARTIDLVVPAGLRFATDFTPASATTPARRFIFETVAPTTFQKPPAPPDLPTPLDLAPQRIATVRELLAVEMESLGISDGTANQTFALRPVHSDLVLPLDKLAPVLLDFVHRSSVYEPNPQVTVGGVAWELKQFLLTEESHIDPLTLAPKNHYMVDADTGTVRFGDGIFGSIPPLTAAIVCTRYQVLQGPDALIAAGSLLHQLDSVPGLMAGESVVAGGNSAGEGGNFFFSPGNRIREGLKRFRRPFRLITAADFEQVMRIDFNETQALSKSPETVLRAVALMNRKPPTLDQAAAGHVTIVVLAASTSINLDDELGDPMKSLAYKQGLLTLTPGLIAKIQRFLDKHRLITTRIHVKSFSLAPFSINTEVMIARDRSVADMTGIVTRRLREFFGTSSGGPDGEGWPVGGQVYRSKLFRLIEDIDGVDHVQSLALAPANSTGDVAIGPLSLPLLSSISVAATRI